MTIVMEKYITKLGIHPIHTGLAYSIGTSFTPWLDELVDEYKVFYST
jgi:hypothetical protein